MRKWRFELSFLLLLPSVAIIALPGCTSAGGTVADGALASAGGVAGYQLSDGKLGGALAGAAVGLVGSRIAQQEFTTATSDAEKKGYDRAMNQAVKQQYWIIQNQQRDSAPAPDEGVVQVTFPETKTDGVIVNAHVENLRINQ
jgi:hypothetical protein